MIGDCEMERMRGEDTYNSRLRKDWRRGEGCWRVKGLSTGHPLYRGRPRRTAFFFYGVGVGGWGLVVPGRTQKKAKQRGDSLLK